MTNFKKLAVAAAIASAAVASHADVVDGVKFNAGDQLLNTSIWESVLTKVTDTLSGVGIVDKISCTGCGGITWKDGNNDTQLTYYFSGYKVSKWWDFDGFEHTGTDNAGFSNAAKIDFTGGNIKLFTDRVTTGTALDPAANINSVNPVLIAADIANAIDGNLWLEYDGVDTLDASGRYGSLFASTNTINSVHAGGAGYGYLNVVGGLAEYYFNTNSWTINEGETQTIEDARLDSSFSNTNAGAWPLSGGATLKTNAIPEPDSLALLGLALFGLGATYRRKLAKKA
jgi:hypothetical protein